MDKDHLQRFFLVARVLFIYFYDEAEVVCRLVAMNLSPKTTCLFATIKDVK